MDATMRRDFLHNIFRNPWVVTAINFTMALAAWVGNRMFQGFCQPVPWAAAMLVVAFFPVVFWPLLRRVAPRLHPIWQFLRGVAFCICIYCLVFLGSLNFFIPVMLVIGVGLPALPLYYFLGQMCGQLFARSTDWIHRGMFLAAFVPMGLIGYYFGLEHRVAARIAVELMQDPRPYDGPHAAAVEHVIGMHFKYHTRPELFDGWRPPLHDPALVVGLWTTGMEDPLQVTLAERVALYHQVFPEAPVEVDCACAASYDGNQYYEGINLIVQGLQEKGQW